MPIHDKELVRLKRIEKKINRQALADILNTSLGTVQRIEEGTRALKIKELLVLAQKLEVGLYEIIETKHHHFLDAINIGPPAKLKVYESYEEFVDDFSNIEQEGRITIHTDFPCSLYLDQTDIAQKRYDHFASHSVENKEFYLLRSLIVFAFSPFSQFSDDQKIKILERAVAMFESSFANQLYFRDSQSIHCNIEILYKIPLLVIELPLHGTSILLIEDKQIVDNMVKYYLGNQNNLIKDEDAIDLLNIVKDVIAYEKSSLSAFYKRCREEKKYGDAILNTLSPSMRDEMERMD